MALRHTADEEREAAVAWLLGRAREVEQAGYLTRAEVFRGAAKAIRQGEHAKKPRRAEGRRG